jgi:hypothetical protein
VSRTRFSVKALGLKDLRQAFRTELRQRLIDAFSAALYDEALRADARAQSEDMAPWDTGRMKQTHYVSPPTESGRTIVCEIGYGVDYAIYVHERTELHHPHGQAKWLQKTLDEVASGFVARIGKKMRRALEKGVSVQAIPATAPTEPKGGGGGAKVLRLPAPKKEGGGA